MSERPPLTSAELWLGMLADGGLYGVTIGLSEAQCGKSLRALLDAARSEHQSAGRDGALDVLADLDLLRAAIEHYHGALYANPKLYGDRWRRVIEAAWRYLNIRSLKQEGGGR